MDGEEEALQLQPINGNANFEEGWMNTINTNINIQTNNLLIYNNNNNNNAHAWNK
jgi:hypothetical protein